VRAAIGTLVELAKAWGGRPVAVLGEMKELGPRAQEEHAAVGDALVEAGVLLAIGCGGFMSVALERARVAGVNVVDAPDVATAAHEAMLRALPGDVILVKGSRSVGAEAVVRALSQRKKAPS
jgi:UDP-N-acetylmuramoyl-tripeptide--D-alanyl-D-alanine ligase